MDEVWSLEAGHGMTGDWPQGRERPRGHQGHPETPAQRTFKQFIDLFTIHRRKQNSYISKSPDARGWSIIPNFYVSVTCELLKNLLT